MSAPLIDSHCHLDFDDYGFELPDVMARARASGVVSFVCIGAGRDIRSARAATDLAAKEADVFATVGIHPHDAAAMTDGDFAELETLARGPRVVGIGETGLDHHYDLSPRDLQQQVFRRFIDLGLRVQRPIICHIRDAHPEATEILRTEPLPDARGIIHCFTGGPEDARGYLDMGFFLSFSGIITFKNADPIRKAALLAPWESILVETDAPYLAPIPHRGKRNEPAFMVKTVEALAALKGVSYEEAARRTTANARRALRLPS